MKTSLHRHSMIRSWLLTALTGGVLFANCGCKQMSTWSGVSPTWGRSAVDPFMPGQADPIPQSEPGLSPAPELPQPGHVTPVDPPPAPAEEIKTTGFSRWKGPWTLRAKNGYKREESSSKQQMASHLPQETRLSPTTALRNPQVASNYGSSRGLNQQRIEQARRALPTTPPAELENTLDDSFDGPVILPGSQYRPSSETIVEKWPHTRDDNPSFLPDSPTVVKLRKPATQPAIDNVLSPSQSNLPPLKTTADQETPPLLPPGP